MARLRDNVLAGYVGNVWIALMGLAFVPIYVRELGPAAYGVVGFMLSLQALSLLLDLGANVHVSREMSLRSVQTSPGPALGRLLRSFEALAWGIALALGFVLFLASGPIARGWLQPDAITEAELVPALWLCAAVVSAGWPGSLYAAALVGLEQQPRLNVIVVVFSTLRFAGVLPLLWFADVGLWGFLAWHAITSFAQTVATGLLAWRSLPPDARQATPQLSEIRSGLRFALGAFTAISLGLLFSQLDKLAISRLLPLSELGVYAVAAAISAGMGRLVMPVFSASYPRFGKLIAREDEKQRIELFRIAAQMVAVLTGSATAVLLGFGQDILHLWTGDAALAERLHHPLAWLVGGAFANALIAVPFALQLAAGDTRPAVAVNLALVLLSPPAFIAATSAHGLEGAAAVWCVANIAAMPATAWLMRRHLPQGEMMIWLRRSVIAPSLGAFTPMLLLLASREALTGISVAAKVPLAVLASLACAALFAPELRRWILASYARRSVGMGS